GPVVELSSQPSVRSSTAPTTPAQDPALLGLPATDRAIDLTATKLITFAGERRRGGGEPAAPRARPRRSGPGGLGGGRGRPSLRGRRLLLPPGRTLLGERGETFGGLVGLPSSRVALDQRRESRVVEIAPGRAQDPGFGLRHRPGTVLEELIDDP